MNRKINKKKIFILILMILFVILISVLNILYTKNLSVRVFFDKYVFRKNITENTLPYIVSENGHFYSFNDCIVCLEKNILSFYNRSANKTTSLDLEISTPIFESNGKFLCVAEKNGNKLCLISNKNILWQKDVKGQITNVSVNKNGYIAISISDTTYKTICKVYSEDGSELFTTYLSKSYVVDSAISNDNKFLALAETNFSGISIQSNIKIISIDKALSNNADSVYYNYVAPIGDLIINIDYCNNNLVCLYDNHIDLIKDTTVSEFINFENSKILFADINNKIIQVEKQSTGILSSQFKLKILDVPNTDRIKTYVLEKEPKSVEVFGNMVAINCGTEAFFINNLGWLVKHYKSSQEIQSVVLSDNLAGIVFKDKIEFLDL